MKQNSFPAASEDTVIVGPMEEKTENADTRKAMGFNWRTFIGLDHSEAPKFRLLRYFSITSAVVLAIVIGVLIGLYRHIATNELIRLTENQNVALAQSFANSIWQRFSTYVDSVAGLNGDAIRARPETHEIHQALKTLTADFPVLKVKIYGKGGLTVYSSVFNEIGIDKSKNPGFISAARRHIPATKLAHKGKLSAFSGVFYNREIVETYIPIPRGDGPVEAVFELYSDVTLATEGIDRATRLLAVSMLVAFGILYTILFLIVRRADQIIWRQYADLRRSKEVIDEKNLELEHEIAIRDYAEQQLVHHHKLKSLGDLAGGLAHNLLNLLQPILMLSEQIREKFPEGSKDRKKFDVIISATSQAAELVNRIRLFGREGEVVEERFDIAEPIDQALDLVSSTLTSNVTIVKNVDGKTGFVIADRAQMETVLLNLARNALHAIGNMEGELNVSLMKASVGRFGDTSVPALEPGNYAKITIADTGEGIDEETLERIFDPFFTTKDLGIGTGLGLSSAYGIINRHGGVITVTSQLNKGSTFDVYIPLGEEETA